MSNTPNYDAKVQAILDATQPGERTCAITGEKWVQDDEELRWYKEFNVPPSAHAPYARMQCFTSFFRSGQWWWNKHPVTGKPLISSVHPACGVPVLPDKEWHQKDFQEVQSEVDLSRSFIDQMFELRKRVPAAAHGNYQEPENSIAVASFGDVNSYFMVASKGKNCFFSIVVLNGENSSEVYNSESITDSYHVIHCERMFNCQYVRESKDCLNALFLFDCRNCEFVFGGSNLRNKKYVWFNEQLTQEEWERRRAEVNTASRSAMQPHLERFEQMIQDAVWPENFNIKSENCVGEYLTNCEDSRFVYYADGGARNNYWIAWLIGKAEHNAFVADPASSQDTYCSTALSSCFNTKFSVYSVRCKDVEYCLECYDSEYCFGCVGLRKKRFCILNKQYTESEYWLMIDAIKCAMIDRGEYAEGVPPKFSLGWFPESGAAKYYQSTEEFGRRIGANVFDPASEGAYGDELMTAREVRDVSQIPDDAKELDGWAGVALFDPEFKRRYSLLAPEIALYQKLKIAPPNTHFIDRVHKYIRLGNAPIFLEASCANCSKQVTIAKNPTYTNRKIYCTECYVKYLESK